MAKKVNKRSNRYPVGFQRDAVERMKHCKDISKLAEELGVSRGVLYLWKRKGEGLLSLPGCRTTGTSGSSRRPAGEKDPGTGGQGCQPGGRVGPAQPGSKFFQKCLAKSRGVTPAERRAWRNSIYDEICSWESQGQMTVQRMCELAGVSRASFYRDWEQKAPSEAEIALRDAIQRMALAHRHHGYRRITPLIQRAGFVVGEDKVRRSLKTDNLLAVRRRKFVVTTDSNHRFRVHPNLAEAMELTAVNQLWIADLTYIRLRREFVFLAVVLDAFSRKVIGWELGRTLETRLPIAALEAAIASRRPQPGLVHHSDRGTQYASNEYVKRLEACGAHLSMSRPARPWENGKCESFIKTLKREEIDARRYVSFAELRQHIEEFIEQIYNRVRLHSALGYRSPEEFESSQKPEVKWSPAALSFFRHEEIYPDV